MKIAVVGMGYVGLSIATLLSQKHEVVALDIVQEKVEKVNKRVSPIKDEYIEKYFKEEELNLKACLDYKEAFEDAKYIIIAVSVNYNEKTESFDTKKIEEIVEKVKELNENPTIIIKSTIPIGYTEKLKEKYNMENIIFVPEFLREGKALYDNLYPSRIIIGGISKEAEEFGEILKEVSLKKDVPVKYMSSSEAEAVKLFSNTYLALRVAYFNELDTFAESNNLNTKNIIEGVCLDSRIGNYYNNPSFGYGGYCLPKDSKELKAEFKDITQNFISAIVESNSTRKSYIANEIIKRKPKTVGMYKLAMKTGSDNIRGTAIIDIIKKIQEQGINVIIYEPLIEQKEYLNCEIIENLEKFKNKCDIIIANRIDESLSDIKEKVYTRDVFGEN